MFQYLTGKSFFMGFFHAVVPQWYSFKHKTKLQMFTIAHRVVNLEGSLEWPRYVRVRGSRPVSLVSASPSCRASPCLRSAASSRIPTRTWLQPPPPPLPPPPRLRCTGTPSWTQCGPDSGTAPTPSPWRRRTARCSPPRCPPWLAAPQSWRRTGWWRAARCRRLLPWIPRRRWPATRPRSPPAPCPCRPKRARTRTPPTSCRVFNAWSADWIRIRTGHEAAHLRSLWD